MRAVLGFLFVLVGLTMAYLVLSGNLPNSGTITTPTSPTSGNTSVVGSSNGNAGAISKLLSLNNASGSGPTGLPSTASVFDMPASRGGMS